MTLVDVFEATVARLHKEAFAKEGGGIKVDDAAFLQTIAAGGEARGKGLSGKLIEDGRALFEEGVPLLLEATEEKVRDVYIRNALEVVGVEMLAKGECDEDGCSGGEADKPGGQACDRDG